MRKWLFAATVLLAIALGAAAFSSSQHASAGRLGVVLLHGKLGTPDDRKSGLEAIARALEAEGAVTIVPPMPWNQAGWEHIAVDVGGSLGQIDDLVAGLRARGASRIVLVGHSLGANVALAYAVTRGGLAGLVMAAPGHRPERMARDRLTHAALERARRLVDSGHGEAPFVGPDGIQGASLTLTTTAAAYLSWMDPEGLAAMEVQAPRLPRSIPLLMVISRHDPFYAEAEARVYRPAAHDPYSRYLPIGANHSTTPMAAATVIANWIERLPR
jgi:pimeloyl-ACP methyl ester carboxylesterase